MELPSNPITLYSQQPALCSQEKLNNSKIGQHSFTDDTRSIGRLHEPLPVNSAMLTRSGEILTCYLFIYLFVSEIKLTGNKTWIKNGFENEDSSFCLLGSLSGKRSFRQQVASDIFLVCPFKKASYRRNMRIFFFFLRRFEPLWRFCIKLRARRAVFLLKISRHHARTED